MIPNNVKLANAPGGKTDKTPILSLVDPTTGEVRSTVIADTKHDSILEALDKQVDLQNTILHTDEAGHYKALRLHLGGHQSVNHAAGEYVRAGVSTNLAEGHFSQFKRSLDGTYHAVSKEHLWRYTSEFDFRRTTRKFSDGERTVQVFENGAGRYLSYAGLIAQGPVARGTRKRPPGRSGPRRAGPAWLPQASAGGG